MSRKRRRKQTADVSEGARRSYTWKGYEEGLLQLGDGLVVEHAQRVNILFLLDLEEFGLQLLHHPSVPLGVLLRLGLHDLRKGRGLLLGFLDGASGLSQASHSKRQGHSRVYDQLSYKRDIPSKRFPVRQPSDVIGSLSDSSCLPDPLSNHYQPPVCIPTINGCNYMMTVCWNRSPRTFSFGSEKTGSLPSRDGPRHDRHEAHQHQCSTEDDHKAGGVGDESHERRTRKHAEVADGRHHRHGEA